MKTIIYIQQSFENSTSFVMRPKVIVIQLVLYYGNLRKPHLLSKVLELLDDGLGFDWDPKNPASFFILGLGKQEPECPSSPEPSPSDSLNSGAEIKDHYLFCYLPS